MTTQIKTSADDYVSPKLGGCPQAIYCRFCAWNINYVRCLITSQFGFRKQLKYSLMRKYGDPLSNISIMKELASINQFFLDQASSYHL
jgi:hypothetical protein